VWVASIRWELDFARCDWKLGIDGATITRWGSRMPEISRFFGISIRMYFDDHAPPHFHAIYAGAEIKVGIDPLAVLRGRFPRRALGMVLEWAAEHQPELLDNWRRLHNDEAPLPIAPLE
jgi:hypothetical protein